MTTILLGLCVFVLSVALLGLGLVRRARAPAGGCRGACALPGRCPHPARAACAPREEGARER